LKKIAEDAKSAGFTDILLLGMGGSSLCPDVFALTYGKNAGFPQLHVLDSTDPAQVKAIENKINPAKTLFVVSSKSGTTLEPNIFKQYFFEVAKKAVGADQAGSRFIAITDPGSKMQKVAETDRFRHIFAGVPSIGGRYSALSNFGMVPGAAMGLDASEFSRTHEMVDACRPNAAVEKSRRCAGQPRHGCPCRSRQNHLHRLSRNQQLGAWLEQLIAESTGKQGKGIIPVDRESLGSPDVYGKDRVFAYLRLETAPDADQDAKVDALEKSGQPVIRIKVADKYDLGQEFFRWEIATAVAGSIIGINAFNQPDVEASKIVTRDLTTAYEKQGPFPPKSQSLKTRASSSSPIKLTRRSC
jgi:glucose-6-phosphate isomerase